MFGNPANWRIPPTCEWTLFPKSFNMFFEIAPQFIHIVTSRCRSYFCVSMRSSFFQQPNTWNGTTYYFPPPQVCVHTRLLQSCPTLCNPMDYSCQVSLSMGFSRQEHWSGLPCLPPGDLPDPGIEPTSPALQGDSLLLSPWGSPYPREFSYCGLKCCSLLFLFLILTSPQNPYLRFCKEPFAKFHSNHNGTSIEHSVVTTIFAKKLMDVGVGVQKYTSHSWWDVFFTKCPTSQKLLAALFNPFLFLRSLYFYWLSEIVI